MSFLVSIISQIIEFLYTVTTAIGISNYGLAIILFTLLIKVILFPLTRLQLTAMRTMQQIQPEIKAIQTKHKDNQPKMQKAMMELYKTHKVNPFSGCWPLLVQLPILYSLFGALRGFFDPIQNPGINLDNAGFFWVSNLGLPDPIILPLLVGVSSYFQQKFGMTGTGDQTQKTLLYIMPVFIGWISRNFPAALALYWVMYSLIGILEHYTVKKLAGTKEGIPAK